jgi:hypothetical protein
MTTTPQEPGSDPEIVPSGDPGRDPDLTPETDPIEPDAPVPDEPGDDQPLMPS